jgi:hypothetical protein
LLFNNSGSFAIFAAIRLASSLVSSFVVETDLAVASGGPNVGPKAKENARPDNERNHNYVPQRHVHNLPARSSRAAAQNAKTIRTPIAK